MTTFNMPRTCCYWSLGEAIYRADTHGLDLYCDKNGKLFTDSRSWINRIFYVFSRSHRITTAKELVDRIQKTAPKLDALQNSLINGSLVNLATRLDPSNANLASRFVENRLNIAIILRNPPAPAPAVPQATSAPIDIPAAPARESLVSASSAPAAIVPVPQPLTPVESFLVAVLNRQLGTTTDLISAVKEVQSGELALTNEKDVRQAKTQLNLQAFNLKLLPENANDRTKALEKLYAAFNPPKTPSPAQPSTSVPSSQSPSHSSDESARSSTPSSQLSTTPPSRNLEDIPVRPRGPSSASAVVVPLPTNRERNQKLCDELKRGMPVDQVRRLSAYKIDPELSPAEYERLLNENLAQVARDIVKENEAKETAAKERKAFQTILHSIDLTEKEAGNLDVHVLMEGRNANQALRQPIVAALMDRISFDHINEHNRARYIRGMRERLHACLVAPADQWANLVNPILNEHADIYLADFACRYLPENYSRAGTLLTRAKNSVLKGGSANESRLFHIEAIKSRFIELAASPQPQ
jgi:hypothetical protein